MVAWVVQALSVLLAASHADSWVDWEKEETKLGAAASGGDVVELGGTAASALSVEDVNILGDGDWFPAWASLGGWVEGGCAAATGVGSGDSSRDHTSGWVEDGWAAKIDDGVVGSDTTAGAKAVGVAVNLATAAKLGGWGVGLETTTRSGGDVGDLEVGDGGDDEDTAASAVGSNLVDGGGDGGAASLGGWIESSGSAALEVAVGVGNNGSIAAKLVGGVESSCGSGAASQTSTGGGATGGGGDSVIYAVDVWNIDNGRGTAASVGGGVNGGGAAASQNAVGVGNDSAVAAELGGWIKGRVGTAGSTVSNGAGNDRAGDFSAEVEVVFDDIGGHRAAKIGQWVEGSVATAGKSGAVAGGGLDRTVAAKLG